MTPYLEGQTWSFRLRLKGQEIYRAGFVTAAEASREAERLRQKILGAGKPKHDGPWRTSLGRALQDYARERLPFMKGAQQDACRINRYLRACGLQTVKVSAAVADKTRPENSAESTTYWTVSLRPPGAPRKVPQGLHAHRQRQAEQKAATDRLRRELARTPVAQVMPYQIQELVDSMTRDGYKPPSVGLERSLLRRLFNYMRETWLWVEPGRNPATGLK